MASLDKQPSKSSSSRTGGICTLSDLNHPSADSYGPQEYYTGGEKRLSESLECPRELEPADRRSSVHVNLIRSVNLIRRNDNCPESERHHVPGSWNFVTNSVSSGNNDQMDMEDSMVEDTVQASTPIAPIFDQPPVSPPQSGFVFGSATPPAANPFQFAQQSSGTPQNVSPFQATNSLGGSFSVGAGDKSGRKIVRVNRNKAWKK